MRASGFRDVDIVLTTRELARMIKQAGNDFRSMPESKCDSLLGESTGAAVIFGATGGVMEAALRTAYEIVTGREVPFKNLNAVVLIRIVRCRKHQPCIRTHAHRRKRNPWRRQGTE